MACAATDVQEALGSFEPDEVEEQGGQALTPPPHGQLVVVTIRGHESTGGRQGLELLSAFSLLISSPVIAYP